jgi:Kef-type K+ transport system membrane component KefB/voltage-gated potassium channel Kch
MTEGGAVFYELALVLALAAAMGVIGLLLRQPLIVAYIATGLLVGAGALSIVSSTSHIDLLAEIGISVLLFLVGLKLDLKIIRTLGAVALATGLGQVLFTSVVGFFICLGLGFGIVTSLYIAVALTFSSTIIIVKLLSDKRELDSLHGRIALGFLIVQDIAVVVAMVVLSAYGVGTSKSPSGLGVLGVLGSGIAMMAFVALFIRYAAEPMLKLIARAPELLVSFSLAWAVLFAAAGDWLGFGKELGGLLAGVSIASTSVREAVATRLTSLRDFLLLFFFVGLGARLHLGDLGPQVPAATILSAFVLIGNPLIVMAIMGYMGYRKRTGFLAGLTVAQISEFSLIFMAMGLTIGHLQQDSLGLVTLVGLVTITLSTYMILYSHQLYRLCENYIGMFERKVPAREHEFEKNAQDESARYDVILFGLGRYGRAMAQSLQKRGISILGIDFDPDAVEQWRALGMPAFYGDAEDPEFPASLPLGDAKWVVNAIHPIAQGVTHDDPRLALTQSLRQAGYRGRVAVRVNSTEETEHFLKAGADIVLSPFIDAAERAVELLDLGEPAKDTGPER